MGEKQNKTNKIKKNHTKTKQETEETLGIIIKINSQVLQLTCRELQGKILRVLLHHFYDIVTNFSNWK